VPQERSAQDEENPRLPWAGTHGADAGKYCNHCCTTCHLIIVKDSKYQVELTIIGLTLLSVLTQNASLAARQMARGRLLRFIAPALIGAIEGGNSIADRSFPEKHRVLVRSDNAGSFFPQPSGFVNGCRIRRFLIPA
jgi:hypothetical protein